MGDQIDFKVQEEEVFNPGTWKFIPVQHLTTEKSIIKAHRLNALGSLFYLSKVVLRNHRLSEHLHLDFCKLVEKEHLKEVIEVPRDHFKSTIYSESAPISWALPFTNEDEDLMRKLGYGDEWIRWMRRAHNQDTRTLLVSENITNAAKLGVRIDGHYIDNDLFRILFPEIIPNSAKGSWTQFSKTHRRSRLAKPHGEGTYDYIGVGGALQSRHYDRVVQDDLVGKAAVESDTLMQKTIDYHKLLVGAFDSASQKAKYDCDEIVVGNRWSWRDLNSYIRENEQYFHFTNHSALGGCCDNHPAGIPIFPEEFTVEKLERFAKRLGSYKYSCQFLNKPTTPEALAFDANYLRYYTWRRDTTDTDRQILIQHEVESGEVLPDSPVNKLDIVMVVDPNHSGDEGRCNHAIVVVGLIKDFIHNRFENGKHKSEKIDLIYLLDCWAESQSYDIFIDKIYEFGEKWKLREFYLETIAAQKYLKYHLEYRNRIEKRLLKVKELKTSRSKDAKKARIEALGPVFENRQFFCQRNMVKFIDEYSLYPNAKTRDILDTLGYAAEIWGRGWSKGQYDDFVNEDNTVVATGPCGY